MKTQDSLSHRTLFQRTKKLIKLFIPKSMLLWRAKFIDRKLSKQSPQQVFSYIYKRKMWGNDGQASDFFSGPGSHNPQVVGEYIKAVSQFLETLPKKPNVVDLGCGDFNVGKQLRRFCDEYIACDVVPELIERNKKVFHDLNVDFRCLDMIEENLPVGDVVFIRQVFQHLSNEQILKVANKLYQYKFLILSESLPKDDFTPNIDKAVGGHTRIDGDIKSGIILTVPPFNLLLKSERIICTVPDILPNNCHYGNIRTIVYQLN